MTKVRLYELIRKGAKLEGLGIRALARRHGIHRRDVRAALKSVMPVPRKQVAREAPVTGKYEATVRGWLEADRLAPRKQRHTARRVWQRLRDEHGCKAAESSVRRLVARPRRELVTSLSRAYVPLVHEPGKEAEVDFYEATVLLDGVATVLQHFCMRACHSGREFHMAFPSVTQQAFLVGHVQAFAWFGGVFGSVKYDNLRPAVKKVLRGREREQTERFIALRGHFVFDAMFCKPGKEGAHEKGGVEGGRGRFRREYLTPVPAFDDLEAYTAYLLACCARDDLRVMEDRVETVAEAWGREIPVLDALPAGFFETDVVGTGRVDTHGRLKVANNRYSVPIGLHGLAVEVRLGAGEVRFFHKGREVARHDRLVGSGLQSLQLDHYLELLREKPGAMPGAIALAQARAAGTWCTRYDALWQALVAKHGRYDGTVQMVDVLLLHRTHGAETVGVAVGLALEHGATDAAAVRHLAHHLDEPYSRPTPLPDLGELVRYQVPVPVVSVFDELLAGRVA